MATQRQIEANRRNSERSTGPKSEEGKARSRLNATTHGLAASLVEVEAADSPAFVERRAKWAAEQQPVGESANWALDRAVAATFRIERCERAVEAVVATSRERARHGWLEDRAAEAASIAAGLTRDPVLASRRLQTSLAGVQLLVEAWMGLIEAMREGRDWSDSERSKALDLLGIAPDLRSGRTLVDPGDGESSVAFRIALAFEELERLETLRDESMTPLDESDRRRALAGDVAILSKPAKLAMRYEREAWRQYRESMAQLHEPTKAPEPPKVISSPPAPERPLTPTKAPRQAGPVVASIAATASVGQVEAGRLLATERSQFVGSLGIATERSRIGEAPAGRILVGLESV